MVVEGKSKGHKIFKGYAEDFERAEVDWHYCESKWR
jgi:hypothetical protein